METAKISVQGTGSVHIVPDVTRLEVIIERWFVDYKQAYEQAKENSSWMVKILEYNKKSGKLAKTIRFNIEDHTENEYDEDGHYVGKIKNGFMLEQVFKIDLPVDNHLVNNIVRGVGKFIQGAQIRILYAIQEERPVLLKAISRAVKDAREKAQIMAESGDCKLGKLLSIDYGHSHAHFASEARYIHSNSEATSMSASSLEITPDDLSFSETVDVVWEMIGE